MFNAKLIAILALLCIAAGGGLYWKGYFSGKATYEQQQVKKTNEIKRKHAKVKRDAPGDTDKQPVIEWLRQRTRQ
ncbi:hypothetical protein [Tautonia marina]|uniref:hypothetical protein n=1 Tax=Tautonia marina TaxID=2653855 RepID=UPI001260B178|nr:hypothetical protein [Tautonia marina]